VTKCAFAIALGRDRTNVSNLTRFARAAACHVRRLAFVVLSGVIGLGLSSPTQGRPQDEIGPRDSCVDACMTNCGKLKTSCYQQCVLDCHVKGAAPSNGTLESAREAEFQVCCKVTRGFAFTYTWKPKTSCKPPKRRVMPMSAKCPAREAPSVGPP
jgi:hypothetical protein